MRPRRGLVRRSLCTVATAASLTLAGCSDGGHQPTITMQSALLRHEVRAEGVLRASRETPVAVGSDVRGRVRLAWLAAEGQPVEAGEVVARFDDSELISELGDGRADLRTAGFKVDKSHADQSRERAEIETQRQVADLELNVAERFRLTDDDVFSRHEIIESRIDGELARVRLEHAVADFTTVEIRGQAALDILDIERGQAQRRVDRAAEGLDALEIRAPHAGLFLRARNWRNDPLEVGAELWSGQPVGEIPDLDSLEAEVFVLEADAGGLEAGTRAQVVVEAHPETVYSATVTRVDTIAKPRIRASPVQYFGVVLAFDQALDAQLKPGQRVQASLLLAEKENVLAVPRQAVVAGGDAYRVACLERGAFVPREVELGETATGLVEITAGLAAGDVVALDPEAVGLVPGSTVAAATGVALGGEH